MSEVGKGGDIICGCRHKGVELSAELEMDELLLKVVGADWGKFGGVVLRGGRCVGRGEARRGDGCLGPLGRLFAHWGLDERGG